MVNVGDDVEARKSKLLVFNLLKENDLELHRSNKCLKCVDFGCVRNVVYVDSCNIVASEEEDLMDGVLVVCIADFLATHFFTEWPSG